MNKQPPHRPVFSQRRSLCSALAMAPAAWLAACATPPQRGADPLPYRLVDRLSWGANDSELEAASRLGTAGYIQAQLSAPATDELPAAARAAIAALGTLPQPLLDKLVALEAQRKAADASTGVDARKAAQDAYQRELTRHAREAGTRHLLRALYSRRQLREQMCWFWFNHFNVHQYKANLRAMLGDYEENAIRPHALGNFRAMLGALAHHPAMLRYLDNENNAAGRGNENYARELLELHTLGVDGGYSQRDVQELARVLTGHGINLGDKPRLKSEHQALYQRQGAYEFNPARHDFGDKQILGRTLRGRGAAELDEALDVLVAHPSTARFVCRRMATFLAADAPSPALVDRMAAAFEGGRTGAALRVLVEAPEFTGGPDKFKDPMHFVLSAVRAAYDDRVVLNTGPIQGWLNRLGEGLYNRATPDGYPLTAEAWNGSGQLAVRFEVARIVGSGSAGLFKPEDATANATANANANAGSNAGTNAGANSGANAGANAANATREQTAFPQLSRGAYYARLRGTLRDETRQALELAASPQEWNTLYLASPEFAVR